MNTTRVLQPRLKIGAVDDGLEHEADRAAASVMSARPAAACACGGGCPRCRSSRTPDASGQLRLKRAGTVPGTAQPAPQSVADALSSPASALPDSTRAFFEPRFGHDFAPVRIHTGAAAERSAEQIGAMAYTVGTDIVFGAGHFSPCSSAGKALLAHELAHVVQQQGPPHGTATPWVQRQPKPIGAATDLSGIQARLDAIIRTGGPLPSDQTRVIGAAIVDIPGYTGPTEIRSISGAGTDALGEGAPVHHATSPEKGTRTLSATRSIGGASLRGEFPFSHMNDAEMKIFEEILRHLPEGSKGGTVHFTTMRNRVNKRTHSATLEPIPACSGCNRATFEIAGNGITMVTHAPAHAAGAHEMGGHATSPAQTKRTVPEKKPGTRTVEAPRTPVSNEKIARTAVPIEMPRSPLRGAAGAALEYGAIALLAAELDAIRGAEKSKAEARLQQLTPEIERFREEGKDVTVRLVVEVPDQVDIAALVAGIGDASQVVYFKKMYIESAVKPLPSTPTRHQVMRANDAPGDPDSFDPHELTLEQQIEMQLGEKYPIKSLRPRKGFHYASRDLTLPAYPTGESPHGPGLPGKYQPAFVKLVYSGDSHRVQIYGMQRALSVTKSNFGVTALMLDLHDNRLFSNNAFPLSVVRSADSFGGRFEKDVGLPGGYRIDSTFKYTRTQDYDVLVEEARGTDLDPNIHLLPKDKTWRATIYWLKVK